MDENLDEQALRELEQELNTKIYPGTEIMRDVGTHHFVKSGHGNHNVLVPQPSDDPHDPLNWSPFWKNTAIFCATALSFSLNLGPLALAPMFGAYIEEWNRSLADVVQFTGVAILCLGFSNFIWVPIMVCFGRRPVAIFATLICVASSIWRALATSYDSFMGACILNGLAAGPCESLMPQVIADVIFLHDRGKYQTLYFAMYFISLMVGPIIAGAMAEHTGWRSFWWFNTGLLIFTMVVNVCLFPETRYKRAYEAPGPAKAGPDPSAAGNKQVLADEDNNSDSKVERNDHAENLARDTTNTSALKAAESGSPLSPQLTHQDPYLGRGTPSKSQFLPWQKREGETASSILRELWLPLYLHIYPIVEFASFIVSWSASAFLVVNLSQTQAFAAPPYNYSSQTIGLFNLAVLIGAVIGLFTSGPLSDWVASRLTARNGGVREPEMRLVAMVPYVLIMILGSVITAVGYDHHWPWQAIVVVGYACVGMQVAALPSIASTYAIDSYKPITGSMFVTITVNKNVWGYGVSKFLTPWAEESGFVPPILMNMAMLTVFASCGIIFWFFGKKFRGITANSFVHKL
ncbi:MFS transporter [Coniochaeta sp. PMI_546]|nr:MFS transporter [Coniochaeta sp. PMI_546]